MGESVAKQQMRRLFDDVELPDEQLHSAKYNHKRDLEDGGIHCDPMYIAQAFDPGALGYSVIDRHEAFELVINACSRKGSGRLFPRSMLNHAGLGHPISVCQSSESIEHGNWL